MSKYTIIDRRVSPKGKNLPNRQRFLERTREWIKNKIHKNPVSRDITSNEGESITISGDDISEPTFDYDHQSGNWDKVLPGNKEFITGDTVKRNSSGQGKGKDASDNGEGEDEFVFTVSKEEYLNILFEDLELPNLIKESEDAAVLFSKKRSGYATSGSPTNLDLEKSLKNAFGRRIALAFPLDKKIKEKELEIQECVAIDQKLILEDELFRLKNRRNAITYIDQVDVRYKRFTNVPIPTSQAVVFCLIDVSGSMGEKEKEIAKRFFLLLYMFVQRKYQKVEIRFVRHTTDANECTEYEFFHDRETGGTIVSAGVKKVNEIIKDDYPLDLWNIYVVQASDGDNFNSDDALLKDELAEILPKCQHYVYNEVKLDNPSEFMGLTGTNTTNVFDTMKKVAAIHTNLSIVNIGSVDKVVSMFRKIFTKKVKNGK